jgi:hypothetical protein
VITSLIVPVLLIARAGQSISLLELLSFAVFALLFPFATVVGLIALGRNLGGQPDLGRGAALYSLAPLVIANVIFAYILAGPADSYWFERGDHLALLYPIGTQNALISFPNWASTNPAAYLLATVFYFALLLIFGPGNPDLLWGTAASGNLIFGLMLLPFALWQSYFLALVGKRFNGTNTVSRFLRVCSGIGSIAAVIMLLLTGLFVSP